MAAFATAEELASLLQRDLDTATAELVLDLASAAIRADVDQQIDQVEDDTVTIDPPAARALLLPELPVTAVTAVKIGAVELVADTDYSWTPAGIIRRTGTAVTVNDLTVDGWRWGTAPKSIEVTYSHGYPAGHRHLDTCRSVCLQAAARAYLNPEQVISKSATIGGIVKSRTWGSSSAAGRIELTEFERRQLDRLRDSL